ncbi:hypothetical protein DMA12_47425 [Amycolatopsis balhimycina DSM 5908]|uniref:Uncharacterized protein n=1 Tax=Amycolatopsis balhimycina DSM 5908 TaxID=1081091 RepID=A0A428VUZ7_AMYBA|nr:hypothetical protein [Amycolatopsis balhimycina]RSM34653.1 hypothetical protein DMA12_47425 [Amycolatopsis balhimycina DSM 5908]
MALTRYLFNGTLHRGRARWLARRVDTLCGLELPRHAVRTPWLPFLHRTCGICEALHQIAPNASNSRPPSNPFA